MGCLNSLQLKTMAKPGVNDCCETSSMTNKAANGFKCACSHKVIDLLHGNDVWQHIVPKHLLEQPQLPVVPVERPRRHMVETSAWSLRRRCLISATQPVCQCVELQQEQGWLPLACSFLRHLVAHGP